MDKDSIREAFEAFDEEGGLEAFDEIKDELSSAFGKLSDLADALERLADAIGTNEEMHGDLKDCIGSIREAQHKAGDAHDHLTDANIDVVEDIGNIIEGQ